MFLELQKTDQNLKTNLENNKVQFLNQRMNKNLFSQRTNEVNQTSNSTKYELNTKKLTNNKINIRKCGTNQSTLRSLQKPDSLSSQIKIIPNQLNFESVETHQMYEIPFFVRNQSNELQKVRIIQPTKKQFKIKYNQNFNNQIAAGLAVKVSVLFCSDDFNERLEDKIIVIGNSFRQQISLIAEQPKCEFQIPKIINVGTIVLKQQRKIQIPIKNKGVRPGSITIQDIKTSEYCPNISYSNKNNTIAPGRSQTIQIVVKPVVVGELQLKITLSDLNNSIIRALVVEQQLQILDQNGSKMVLKDFGELMIGEKNSFPIFIANSTDTTVQCILQTFSKKKQLSEIKIDKKRNMFISETSPQQFTAQVESSSFSVETSKMQISSFSTQKNTIFIQKVPSVQEINYFVSNLTKNSAKSIYKNDFAKRIMGNNSNSNETGQLDTLLTGRSNQSAMIKNVNNTVKDKLINETLAVKFSNQDKIIKIPLKFLSKIPNVQINTNVFQFESAFIKQSQEKQFVIKNLSSNKINLNFQRQQQSFKQNFKLQGPQQIAAFSEVIFKIKFRPLIKKKFIQTVNLKVFDIFPIQIKIFAQCLGADETTLKQKMSLTMTDRKMQWKQTTFNCKSLLKDKTSRQPKQLNNSLSVSKNLNKIDLTHSKDMLSHHRSLLASQSGRLNNLKQDDQIAKVITNLKHENMGEFKQTRGQLFFKKQDYLKSTKRSKPYNQLSNLREILRYQTLSLQQLKKIEVLQTSIQFGHIFIGSKTSKKLSIVNKLQNPILFELDTQGASQLSENSQQPLRIQGYATYEVEINLHPTQLGELQLPLSYIINRQHIFEIKITAIVTLVNLELSSRSFVFNFNEDENTFQKQQNLKVYNNGNKKTKFLFYPPQNRSFQLTPLEGELQPKSYTNISIMYRPLYGDQSGEQRVDIQKLRMKVHEGAENIIKCTGTVKQPKISIKQTQFICENALVSIPISNKISIKNHSKVQTYVKIEVEASDNSMKGEDLSHYFNIQNSTYTLNAQEKKQINFTFICHQIRKIDVNIVVSIRGYKVTRIPFLANLIYPEVIALTPKINFQDVPIMSNYCIQMFSLVNTTQSQIKLEIDPNYPKDEYFCQILAVKDKNLQINYEDDKNKTFLNSFVAAFKDNKMLSKRKSIISNKILTLPPNGEQSVFNIKFVPKHMKRYQFQLPLRLYGCVERIVRPVNLQIECNAIDPVVYVQPQAIKFDTKVVSQAKSSYSQSIFISNPHNYGVMFRIEPLARNCQPLQTNKKVVGSMNSTMNGKTSKQNNLFQLAHIQNLQNFSFSQYEGQIQPNGKIEIYIVFKPTIEGQFSDKFTIFLGPKGQDIKIQGSAISSYIMDVNGSAILPTLKFNCNQAIMPVVPLNMQSRIFIMIQNHGYDAITICKWKTSNHFAHTQIKVNFIEGKLLSLAKKSLRIQVIFSSLAPISFTTMLEFYDEYGNKYELPLSCTSQNSVFTSYPYLESDNQHAILFNNQEKLVKVVSTGKNSFYEQSKQLSGSHTMSCLFIQKWLNFQLNMNLKSFPEGIIDSNGKQFIKFVNRISSKNIIKKYQFIHDTPLERDNQSLQTSNQVSFDNPKGKITKIIQIYQLYSESIKKLKSQGAFLNHIRPQFLLNYSQYVNYQNHKRLLVCSQSIFQVTSVQSWISLFYQLCKIYVQPQITQKILSKLKVQNKSFSNSNLTSNLYSSIQISLLKFINFYLTFEQTSSHNGNTFVNFTQQIKIFEVIQKILEFNFQLSLTEQINSLKNAVSIMSPHVFLSSISKFLHTQLKEFGLSAYLTSTDLFTMGVKELILYFINLVQMIYHYNNANFVKFEGAVGDKITKVIELENPTNKKINYFVKIISSQNTEKQSSKSTRNNNEHNKKFLSHSSDNLLQSSMFIPEKNQIIIEPRQKAELKVVYHCRNAKGESANLYLIPTKQDDDYTIPQPLMFKLTTSILSKVVIKKINLTVSLYEVTPIHLDVELPSQIPDSAQFSLSLFEQTANNQNLNASINPPSFIFNQSHVRALKEGNKDSLQLKLVPLSIGQKICKISYLSSLYGQFIYEIHAKITNPKILKQFKIKDIKVNSQQEVSICINKQNQFLNSLVKVYYPEIYNIHNKTQKNIINQGTKKNITSSTKLNLSLIEKSSPKDLKYQVEILDNQYVTLAKNCNSIDKLDPKQNKIMLKVHFTRPFKEYSCILSVKNELLKDTRLYKIVFIVTSPPKIIKMQFKTTARQAIMQKIPIKIAPCEVSFKTNCSCFSIENISRQYYINTELICHFNPVWVQQKQAIIAVQNKQTLEEIIYEISLKAEQPQSIGVFQLTGSQLFNQQVTIPIDISETFNNLQQDTVIQGNNSLVSHSNKKGVYFEVKRLFKRPHRIQSEQFYPFLNSKIIKSNTGIYIISSNNFHPIKESTEKGKAPKTKSLIQQKVYKNINLVLHPSDIESESGVIRLCKPNSEQYYWAKIIIKNRSIQKLKPLKIQQKINHTKRQNLEAIFKQQNIDFEASDFQYKFQNQKEYLKFSIQNSQQSKSSNHKTKKPVIIFSPSKELQTNKNIFFKCNNKEYMLPIQLKADPMPTIIVPQITTVNVEQKHTYINLINGTQEQGNYKVVIITQNDPNNRCFRFSSENSQIMETSLLNSKNQSNLTYHLNPKQKKQIKISFKPNHINQKQKFTIKFESQTLPNYTYILNGRSQFKVQQQSAQFQVYEDNIKPFMIQFTNLFQRKQYFTAQIQQTSQKSQGTTKIEEFIKIDDPINKKFNLQESDTKRILISVKDKYFINAKNQQNATQNKNEQSSNFKFTLLVKMGEKVVKKYYLSLLIIKNLFSVHKKKNEIQNIQISIKNKLNFISEIQKIAKRKQLSQKKNSFVWNLKARQTVYETIQLPGDLNLTVKQIKCQPQISKYLTFTCINQQNESTNNISGFKVNHLKIKYSPMKPIKRKKYDLILIGQKDEKYRIQCEIFVEQSPVDDIIVIKTTQIDQVGCVSFKLTNTHKSSAKYHAYFIKNLPEFGLQSEYGILQGYGKPGTSIVVKFKSHINNRRLEQKLIIQTEDMYWCFKVKGMLSKDNHN